VGGGEAKAASPPLNIEVIAFNDSSAYRLERVLERRAATMRQLLIFVQQQTREQSFNEYDVC
jgi:hypothetical protein